MKLLLTMMIVLIMILIPLGLADGVDFAMAKKSSEITLMTESFLFN